MKRYYLPRQPRDTNTTKGVFSSVLQATGQDQCRTLQMQLEKRGY
eukprot:COSAG06_NODE_52548_length_305_cov_0.601942_1_plen_44_part_10